jgi:hypothetical protein
MSDDADKPEVAKERVSLFCVVTSDGRLTVCKDEEHAKFVRANWCVKLPVIRIDVVP